MVKGSFFHNYFYGKSGKKDFTESDLPGTRLQLFGTVLSVRRGGMLSLNLLYLLFWIPAILWTGLNLIHLSSLAAASAESLAVPGLDNLIYSWLLVMFPLSSLTGPFNMGVSTVMRNWARDEHSFVWMDFWAGVRANWKQGLLFGLINGAAPLLAYVCFSFYSQLAGQSLIFYLPLAVILIAAVFWTMMALLLPTMLISYELRFGTALKNALLMTLAALPRAFGALIATHALPLILVLAFLFVPGWLNWLTPIVLLFFGLFGLSFNKLIAASYANALCEKYLNTKIDGARVGIGLRSASETKLD